MERNKKETIKVYSPIYDAHIKDPINLCRSPIWKEAYHEDEDRPEDVHMYIYEIKFEGLKPIQCTKWPKSK